MHGIFLSYVVLTPPKLGPLILTHFSKPIFELKVPSSIEVRVCVKNWIKFSFIIAVMIECDELWQRKKNEKCCQIWLRKEQRDKIMHEQWNEKKERNVQMKKFWICRNNFRFFADLQVNFMPISNDCRYFLGHFQVIYDSFKMYLGVI